MAHTTNIQPMHQKRRRPVRTMLLIAAAAALLTTAAFAAEFFVLKHQPLGQYADTLSAGVDAGPSPAQASAPAADSDTVTFSGEAAVSGPIYGVDITATWLPEGMVNVPGESIKWWMEDDTDNSFSLSQDVMNTGEATFSTVVTFVESREDLTINGHEAVYYERQWGDELYIAYPELNSVVTIWAGTNTARDDLLRFAEGLSVTQGDVIADPDYLTTLYQAAAAGQDGLLEDTAPAVADEDGWITDPDNSDPNGYKFTLTRDEMNSRKVGETASGSFFTNSGSFTLADECRMDIKVTDVSVADDFSDLDPAYIDSDMADLLVNGKLPVNTLRYIQYGDGVNTLHKEVASEEVALKTVAVTLDITNTTGQDLTEVGFFFRPIAIRETADGYAIYRQEGPGVLPDGTAYDGIAESIRATRWEMPYYTVTSQSDNNGSNYIDSLPAGETVTIQFAWIVNADELPYLYLTSSSNNTAFTRGDLANGYIDLGL